MSTERCPECGRHRRCQPDHEDWCSKFRMAKVGGWVLAPSRKIKHKVVEAPYHAHPSFRADGSLITIGTYVRTACGREVGALAGYINRRDKEKLLKARPCKECLKEEG